MTSRTRTVAAALCLAALVVPMTAHDFWIDPSTFEPDVDAVVRVGLRVGPGFDVEPVARNSKAIESFYVAGPSGRMEIPGRDGVNPAGLFRVSGPGTLVIAYRSLPSPLRLDAAAFEQYLRDEGLERIIEARARTGRSAADGVERFSRSVKSILVAGGGPRDGHDRVLGLTFELVPERHPASLASDGRLPVRLLYQGAPLEGALVMALPRRGGAPLRARTDRGGRVTFTLEEDVWLIKAVHMVPAPAGSGADWDSIWASLTFKATRGSNTRASR